jgi:uncharacterized protein (TIGR02145 family)
MKIILYYLIISTLLISTISCNKDSTKPSEEELPSILSLNPSASLIGDEITILGTNFGVEQNSSIVFFTGAKATEYINWSNTEIKVEVPNGAISGNVWLEIGEGKSNEVYFTVNSTNPGDNETVTIGDQVWMQHNLDVDHYRNGDEILHCQTESEWLEAGLNKEGAWCYYENDPANGEIYGKLYNWYSVNDSRGLAPKGWHLPGEDDWMELEFYISSNEEFWCDYNSEFHVKALASKDLWEVSSSTCAIGNNPSANNATGFTGRPGGYRSSYDGYFYYIGNYGIWWSSTEYSSTDAMYRVLHYHSRSVSKFNLNKSNGHSVRCIKDD